MRNIHLFNVYSNYKSPDLSNIKYIGIDEHSIRKGQKYVTIIVDLVREFPEIR